MTPHTDISIYGTPDPYSTTIGILSYPLLVDTVEQIFANKMLWWYLETDNITGFVNAYDVTVSDASNITWAAHTWNMGQDMNETNEKRG